MRVRLLILQVILFRGEGYDVGKDHDESGVMRHADLCVDGQCTCHPLKEVMYLKTPRMEKTLIILHLANNNNNNKNKHHKHKQKSYCTFTTY